MSTWGDDIDGRIYSDKRGLGMTETEPPVDYRWHHYSHGISGGSDSTVSPLAKQTVEDLHEMRINWLDQFDLTITEEGDYRYWRWYNKKGVSVWWERRLLGSPLPKVPGLWPNDG